jgi:hypothetical protein
MKDMEYRLDEEAVAVYELVEEVTTMRESVREAGQIDIFLAKGEEQSHLELISARQALLKVVASVSDINQDEKGNEVEYQYSILIFRVDQATRHDMRNICSLERWEISPSCVVCAGSCKKCADGDSCGPK